MRRVVSLWLPRFATDRLHRAAGRDSRRAPPLATVEAREGRLLLVGLDRGASAAGLRCGQPLGDARAILPSLRTAPADPAAENRALRRLAGWCERYSPWTATVPAAADPPDGAGAFWLDVTGCDRLFGGEEALAGDLAARLAAAGYEARAAIADTPGAAWAVCRFATCDAAPVKIVARGGARRALAPLPAAALRLAPGTVAALDALGLRSVGALLELPRAAVADRFGGAIADRLDAALGAVNEPIAPLAPRAPCFARVDFAEPIGRSEDIAAALDRLLGEIAGELERAGRGARRLALTLFEPAGRRHRFAVGTGRPARAHPGAGRGPAGPAVAWLGRALGRAGRAGPMNARSGRHRAGMLAAIVGVFLLHGTAVAKDLGVRGETWAIAEPDLLLMLEARLHELERSGAMAAIEDEARARVRARIEAPEPVAGDRTRHHVSLASG